MSRFSWQQGIRGMSDIKESAPDYLAGTSSIEGNLLEQYDYDSVRFASESSSLYERHLLFDKLIDPAAAGARERFEAVARSVRDVLSQCWIRTEQTYDQQNPKRIYYLSMEFLIGRSLGNNVINLLLDPFVQRTVRERDLDWPQMLEEEPDAGLGNG